MEYLLLSGIYGILYLNKITNNWGGGMRSDRIGTAELACDKYIYFIIYVSYTCKKHALKHLVCIINIIG